MKCVVVLLVCEACIGHGGLPPQPALTDKNVKEVLDVRPREHFACLTSWRIPRL